MIDSTIKHIATVFPVNADALKPDPKFRRRRSIIREFSLNTSTHGVPGIARSQSIHNRIFWTVSFLAFTGIMLYFIIQSMQAFFSYPTQTSVSVIVERLQTFPAVSICNYAPIRFDTFIVPFLNYTNSRNLTNTNDTSTITSYQYEFVADFIQYLINNDLSISNYLFHLQPMLISCFYNNLPCTHDDFIPFLSATYGLCYTFNAKMILNQTSIRNATDNGGTGTLQLKLYAYSHQYVPYVSDDVSAGMVAMIHDNTELPLIAIAGIELAPGRRHKLSFKKRTYNLLSYPYSDCTTKIPLVMQAMFNRYQGADYAYSPVLCNLLCTQTYVYQQCNCIDPNQWTARSIVIPGTDQIVEAPLCNMTDPCYDNATTRITNTDSIWNQFCSHCSEACSAIDFTITTSSVLAPSLTQIYQTKTFVENSGIPLPTNWSETWMSEIENNYVGLDVVCETFRIETYTEDATISGVDLLSNIGGLTGLWIGISFLSIMEFVEMLYRLLRYHCYVIKMRKRSEITINEEL